MPSFSIASSTHRTPDADTVNDIDMYLPSWSLEAVSGILIARDEDGGADVPIAAIVGGTLGGIALAILAVVGWKLWGRSIKRKVEAIKPEAVATSNFLT